MKKILMALVLSGLTLTGVTVAQATTYTFTDNYKDSSTPLNTIYGATDSIGLDGDPHGKTFDITQTKVTISGSQITFNLYSLDEAGYFNIGMNIPGFGLGDLFLDTKGGTTWNYAVALQPTSDTTLYKVLNTISNGSTRTNQAAYYNPYSDAPEKGTDLVNAQGSWSIIGPVYSDGSQYVPEQGITGPLYDYLSITIDLPTTVWNGAPLGFHWTMACGNDVVQDVVRPVPEPATMLLLGTGIVGLAGFARRRAKK